VEGARGKIGVYLISNGDKHPYHVKLQKPGLFTVKQKISVRVIQKLYANSLANTRFFLTAYANGV